MEHWRKRIVGEGDAPPEDLLANPKNWRVHPRAQQTALASVLEEVGWVQRVIVNRRTGHVIDGHLRVELAISRGEPTVPVLYVDLDPAEEDLVLATLDPIAALATADKPKLTELLQEIHTANPDVRQLLDEIAARAGLDRRTHAADDPGADLDRAEELQRQWGTALGQLWTIPSRTAIGQQHRLLVGDATSRADLQRLFGGKRAKLVYTDPPYGVGYDGGTKRRSRITGDEDASIYDAFLAVLDDFVDPQAPLYLWHAGLQSAPVLQALERYGWVLRAQIIWNKNQAQFGNLSAQYHQKHEPCWYAHRRGQTPYWYGPPNEVTVWDCDRARANDLHPTQKPVALAERALRNSSRQGDLVLDAFLGSASTMVAAETLGRVCYGVEVDPRYAAVALERLRGLGLEPTLDVRGSA